MPKKLSKLSTEFPLQEYDYIFCGVGASASLVLLQLHNHNLLVNKHILLIDPDNKRKKDKTFCFWAEEEEAISIDLRNIISHKWQNVWLAEGKIESLKPLEYNHIASIDLYNEVHNLIEQYGWEKITDSIDQIKTDKICPFIEINGIIFRAKYIFDSRPPDYRPSFIKDIHIFQSFVGWLIKTETPISNPDAFRFMDFQIDQQNSTQFIYVLPFSENTALVEVTRFGEHIIEEHTCKKILEEYIETIFGKYAILDVETGCIPMSNAAIDKSNLPGVISLGARNYQIKPSTGYAFKNMYYQSRKIVEAIKNNQALDFVNKSDLEIKKGRFAFYDNLLLDILKNNPKKGKPIFEALLAKTKIKLVLTFLDEKTNLKHDIFIFSQLPWAIFIKTILKRWFQKNWFRPLMLLLIAIILLLLGNHTMPQKYVSNGLILGGMISVGIPHGAVDHLLESGRWDRRVTPLFIVKYLFLAACVLLLWFANSSIALSFFLIYSSWHFGQADGKRWGFSRGLSMFWGSFILFFILGTHIQETNQILQIIDTYKLSIECPLWLLVPWFGVALFKKNVSFILTIIWLLLSAYLPLIISFSLYFIGQHSITGWYDIKKYLNMSNRLIWLHSLPFHSAAWIFLSLFLLNYTSTSAIQEYDLWAVFFIFISSISFPHVIYMNYVYPTKKKMK